MTAAAVSDFMCDCVERLRMKTIRKAPPSERISFVLRVGLNNLYAIVEETYPSKGHSGKKVAGHQSSDHHNEEIGAERHCQQHDEVTQSCRDAEEQALKRYLDQRRGSILSTHGTVHLRSAISRAVHHPMSTNDWLSGQLYQMSNTWTIQTHLKPLFPSCGFRQLLAEIVEELKQHR
jgi:hypothetical protein